ncbi:MAG TPA: efflux RND transporter periplasmic adaptor subunit [Castellaniella sp.]|uniref:efflux RND transporter periplasmic adaptor subunit n=1 Tax=Castellaniella sp. TaxID=1955812 RepID=UPI002F1516CF
MAADKGTPDITPSSAALPARHLLRNLLLIVIVLAAVVFATRNFLHSRSQGPRGRPAAAVNLATATQTDIPVTVTALGTVQPLVTATVRSQLSGVLFKLLFQDGQMVQKGQVLAQIDPRPYQIALEQAKANLARDSAQLASAQADLKRYETLLRQSSIAAQQVDDQRATVRQLQGTVAADHANVDTAQLNLSYTQITSPISGRAGIRQVDIGNYLTPSDTNGIVVVTQLDPIDVSFSLPQSQISEIGATAGSGAGLPVQVRDQNNDTLLATGKFLTLDNQVNVSTGAVLAKARFDNAHNRLFPNQFVNISVQVKTLHNVVTVPVSAIRHGAPGDFVFVAQPNHTVKLTPVKTGPGTDDTISVLSGLAVGASVVTEGADGLEDGSAIRLPEMPTSAASPRAGSKTTPANPPSGSKAPQA